MKMLLIAAAFLALYFTGCQTSVNTLEPHEKKMVQEFVENKQVITDNFLRNRLEIQRVDKQELSNGLLKVQVTAKNMRVGFWDWLFYDSDAPYDITYRFYWLNQAGMEVQTAASTWLQKHVQPGETFFISSVAPNEQCKDFLLELKELK